MIIPFSSIESSTIQQACTTIRAASKKRLRDAKLFDFIMQDGIEIPGVHGVYFFFAADNETCLYVGKNSSPQFIERIPWHFALGEESWQNHFLKYYRRHYQSASLFEAAQAAGDCHILLMPALHEVIAKAETFFRVFLKPRFNTLASGRRFLNLIRIPLDSNLGEAIRCRS